MVLCLEHLQVQNGGSIKSPGSLSEKLRIIAYSEDMGLVFIKVVYLVRNDRKSTRRPL